MSSLVRTVSPGWTFSSTSSPFMGLLISFSIFMASRMQIC